MQVLRQRDDVTVVGLLTTFNQAADRVAMHAVRRQLTERQAAALGVPLIPVWLPWPCPNSAYETALGDALEQTRLSLDIDGIAFGDLFLEEVRAYRDGQMERLGLEALYPIWHTPTGPLAREMIDGGLQAILTCVDPAQCPAEFAGRQFDGDLLADLPDSVDPCGENGEFHTFAYAGPMFDTAIAVRTGEIVERDGFVFADVLPVT